MDERLIAWARTVKARRGGVPLWFFTDPARVPDPLSVIARLPRGLCGVVWRDADAALARRAARLCRARRLAMTVPEPRLARALGVKLHLRRGRRPPVRSRALTGSAHSLPELRRARAAGVCVIFLSPACATASHAGARALGPLRWNRLRAIAGPVAALGGIDGRTVRRLRAEAVGAIGAFLD